MPQFYLIPKKLARAYPQLGKLSQWLEAQSFRFIFWFMDRLSPERASALSATAFSLLGPYSEKAKKAYTNLSIAFPESSEEWRRQTVRQIFRNLGKSAAELIKLEQIWEQRDERLEFVLEPAAREHLEAKQPAVFVCAHVGPWVRMTRLRGRSLPLYTAGVRGAALASRRLDLLAPADEGRDAAIELIRRQIDHVDVLSGRRDPEELVELLGSVDQTHELL